MSGPLQAGATTMPSADFSYPLPSCYLPDSPLWWTGCEISPDKSVNCPCTTASFTVFPGSATGPPKEDAHLPQELGLNISVAVALRCSTIVEPVSLGSALFVGSQVCRRLRCCFLRSLLPVWAARLSYASAQTVSRDSALAIG